MGLAESGRLRVFKNFSSACKHYGFPGSHQVGSYGPKGAGIVRTYSNATPGKDIVLDEGALFLYRLKDEAVRKQFQLNADHERPVRVFRKVALTANRGGGSTKGGVKGGGVVDLGLFTVDGFVPAGEGDQIEKFGGEFVRFVKVADWNAAEGNLS